MLIESIILDESFKDAQAKFSNTANPDEVKQYIDKFKELSKRNIIKGQDKDIGTWIKGDWDSFKKFVDSNSAVVTNRQSKVEQKKDSIVVYKDNNKQVVVPLTKEASIQYGKNTDWCTAYTKAPNQFIKYFYTNKLTLFYVLFKDGNKYACVFQPKQPNTIECFDQEDKTMYFVDFEEATGISKTDIQNWYNSNKTKIEDSRDLNKCSEEAQLDAVTQYWSAIIAISNPSEEVQLLAVKTYGYAIEYIDNPSEEVQIAAVTQDGHAIKHILDKDITPSEVVQLAAVTQHGYAIGGIIDKGIIPSEEVQIAAVKNRGGAIEYIIAKGIDPSEEVQLAAVTNTRYAITLIKNPSEKVKALHKKLWGS